VDYLKAGLPITLIVVVTLIALIPIVY